MKSVLLCIMLLVSFPSYSNDVTVLENIIGSFEGSVFSNSVYPIVTNFKFNEKGEISGTYIFEEESGPTEGSLRNIKSESAFSFLMVWEDKYGKGTLRILFSEDYQAFKGFWGDSQTPVTLLWDGVKK